MNKKGMELALSTIVVIILSVVIFAFGAVFVFQFLASTEELSSELDAQTTTQIETLLTQGAKVAVPLNTVTLEQGEQAVFGYGILNVLPERVEFQIDAYFAQAFDQQNQQISVSADDWLRFGDVPFVLNHQESHRDVILVSVPGNALPGTYIYNLEVFHTDGRKYDTVKKFYVKVV